MPRSAGVGAAFFKPYTHVLSRHALRLTSRPAACAMSYGGAAVTLASYGE